MPIEYPYVILNQQNFAFNNMTTQSHIIKPTKFLKFLESSLFVFVEHSKNLLRAFYKAKNKEIAFFDLIVFFWFFK